jgi:hypothetical protein
MMENKRKIDGWMTTRENLGRKQAVMTAGKKK